MGSLKQFKTRVAPAKAFVLDVHGPCRRCGRGGVPTQLYLAVGDQGGDSVWNLKALEGELGLREFCAGGL